MMSIEQILLYPAILLIGLLLGKFLPGYFYKKAENLATKEDIEEITEKIESVKAAISSRLQVSQFRYQKEFEVLSDLAAKTVDFRDATTMLRPSVDYSTNDEAERKKIRYGKWQEAGGHFYYATERNRPFYPEEIFQEVKALEKLCHMESTRYQIYSGAHEHRNYDPKYWEEASVNADKINVQTEKILQAIRDRTKSWEEL